MTKHAQKPLILVDGSSYLYRAFHALPPLTNSKGQPTGAAYGVINMLRKLCKDYQPEHIAVIFDAKGKTFRDELYAEYKANRPPMPDDLQLQIKPLHALIKALGIPLLMVEGFEADDVIGTLAQQAKQHNMSVIISTGDKDMAQLVNSHVTLINTMTETVMDKNGVKEKFGVPADRIIDYLSLIGDTVDNIPGVPKVGPKTAVKWLETYGNLDNIIAHANDISGKVGENLRASLEQLPLSRRLATIHCDIDLGVTLDDLRRTPEHTDELAALLKDLEFKTWLKELLTKHAEDTPKNYLTILTQADFDAWLAKLQHADELAIDTETTSLNALEAKLVGLSFAIKAHEAIYIPVGHDYPDAPPQLDRDWVLKKLKHLLEDPKAKKIGQHLKYDLTVLKNYDIALQGIAHDTMLQSYILSGGGNRHDMDSLALKYLGYKTTTYEEVAGKGAKQINFSQVPLETASPYAAEDADITLQLHHQLWPQLQADEKLHSVYQTIELPLIPVLARMEQHGVLIDKEKLHQQSTALANRITALETQAHHLAGTVFNLGSPKQLQEIFYEKLGLPVLQKTATGQPSTAESVLQELALDYPLPKLILEHRSLSKLKSTYTDKLPLQINPRTGRVHTSYNQAVTATGRLSSSDPNLQNIPIRTQEGRQIRQAFIAPPGYKIIAADYSQIELRIMAHLAQDHALLDAFAHNVDIHRATAAEVFGVELDAVTAEQRRKAKAINFGLIYGMSAFGLAKQLNVDRDTAQEYIHVYFQRYPGVKVYMDDTRAHAHKIGYVETLFGRRLYLPEINSRNIPRQKAAERTAINAPMQGTAADIIKRAMIHADQWLSTQNISAHMIMQVHDELVFEVAEDVTEIVTNKIAEIMAQAAELHVPLIASVGMGHNWEEAHS